MGPSGVAINNTHTKLKKKDGSVLMFAVYVCTQTYTKYDLLPHGPNIHLRL